MAGSIRKRGKESWELLFDVGRDPATGRRLRRTITFRGSRKDAEKAMTDALYKRDTGLDVVPVQMTVAEYLERWLRDYASTNVAKSTYASYANVVRRRLVPTLGTLRLQELRPAHIQAAYAEYLTTGVSSRTVAYYHAVLRQSLKHALQWQLVARNSADAVTPPRAERPEIQVLAPEEAARLLDAARGSRLDSVIRFALHTGMREGEILALTWRDVDLTGGKARIQRSSRYYPGEGVVSGPTKTHRSRRQIALAKETVRALREHRAAQNEARLKLGPSWMDNDLVFPNELGEPWPARNFYRRYKKLAAMAGLPDLRFHDLRHTAATLMLRAGVDPKTVCDRLGHATVAFTLDVYAHVLPDMQTDAAEKLATSLAFLPPSAADVRA